MTIPDSVTSIGLEVFSSCTSLTNLTFLGDAPRRLEEVPVGNCCFWVGGYFSKLGEGATVYYYYGTADWGPTYGGLPTVMLGAPTPRIGAGSAGLKPGGFGFTLAGVINQTVMVEASTNLVNWQPIWTNTLSGESADFVDPQWVNHPHRFYRARSD